MMVKETERLKTYLHIHVTKTAILRTICAIA